MTERNRSKEDVDQFICDHIDTVPHLEALLLLWNSRPQAWSPDETAKALFVTPGAANAILQDLVRRGLIVRHISCPETYRYEPQLSRDQLVSEVDATYRRELVRLSRMIHSKPSASIREFARAFRLKKEGE